MARWFADFVNAPDPVSLQGFGQEVIYLASTKGSSTPINLGGEVLSRIQREARSAINWLIEERDEEKEISEAPLNPIRSRVILQRVGDRVERNFLSPDFEGAILFHLFDVLCSNRSYFARCKTCHRIFARRGRQLFCSRRCVEGARPSRREYYRGYMSERRAHLKKIVAKHPNLAGLSIREARKEAVRRASR